MIDRRALPLLALLTCLTWQAPPAHALDPHRAMTQYVHRIWQTQQGLPAPTVTCIRQTSDGYLWLGTRSGLVRFDGVRFTSMGQQTDSLLDDAWIQDLEEDRQRALWVATDGAGIFRLRGDEALQFRRADGLPSDNVHCLLVDREGKLWAGTDQGLARFDGERFSPIAVGPSERFEVRALCLDARGNLWVGGGQGQLARGHGSQFALQTASSLAAHDVVTSLKCTPEGILWVGTSRGLLKLREDDEQWVTSDEGVADDYVVCLALGRDQCLWVGTKDGLSRVRDGQIDSFGTDDGLSQSTVCSICEDREGGLWVGTKHGLNQFVDRRTTPFTVSEGLPSNRTGPVIQDRNGTIWVGTLDAGLARFDGREFSAVAVGTPPVQSILALCDGPDGTLWIGTDQGLFRLHGAEIVERWSRGQGLPADTVKCLEFDARGALWIGTSQGLAVLRDGQLAAVGEGEAAGHSVTAIVDCGPQLLVAIDGRGVFRCVNDELTRLPLDDQPTTNVDAFYRDEDGTVWLGTRGAGLLMLAGDRVFRFSSKAGLYDDEIYGITADDRGRLWMACSEGVFFVARDELHKFAAGQLERLKATAFTPLDALRTIECQQGVQPEVQRAEDGRIWFSTIRGLVVVDPNALQRQLPATPVVVEKMVVNGASIDPRLQQIVGRGQANVSFQYAALSYASPSRISFRYRLEGFDKDWIEAENRREAFYTNLGPGDYAFSVVANNVDGKQYELKAPVRFAIAPRFYQTAWFWPACGLVLGLGAWLVYRLRVGQIRDRMHAIVAERSRIARELHDTLLQGFSGITMEMQALAAQLPDSKQKETLGDIIHDAGDCMREARRSVAGLRGNQSGLSATLAQAARQLAETHDVRLKLQLDAVTRTLPIDVEYNLLRIAQEAITNAIKHANARTIEVNLHQSGELLSLTVDDDGLGFVADGDRAASSGHYGLIGMSERARQIGADLEVESAPGRGTRVRIVLPFAPLTVKSTLSHG